MGFLTDNFISRFFTTVIELFYGVTGDYVLAIILFTVAIKIVLLPLDISQKRSSQRLQAIAPKTAELRARYKNDPQKLSLATRELYKKENVSQSGGCLLTLLQFPIMIAMFGAVGVLSRMNVVEFVTDLSQDPQLLPHSFLWVHNIWQPDTGLAPVMPDLATFQSTLLGVADKLDAATLKSAQEIMTMSGAANFTVAAQTMPTTTVMGTLFTEAYKTIPQATIITAQTYNYATVVQPVLEHYANLRNGFFLFPLLAGASQFLALWYTSKKQVVDGKPQQGMMMQLMLPMVMVYFSCTTGTLFAVYYTLTSLWSFGQQLIMDFFKSRKKTAEIAER